jgi:hypothetical protein
LREIEILDLPARVVAPGAPCYEAEVTTPSCCNYLGEFKGHVVLDWTETVRVWIFARYVSARWQFHHTCSCVVSRIKGVPTPILLEGVKCVLAPSGVVASILSDLSRRPISSFKDANDGGFPHALAVINNTDINVEWRSHGGLRSPNANNEPRGETRQCKGACVSPRRLDCFVRGSLDVSEPHWFATRVGGRNKEHPTVGQIPLEYVEA